MHMIDSNLIIFDRFLEYSYNGICDKRLKINAKKGGLWIWEGCNSA